MKNVKKPKTSEIYSCQDHTISNKHAFSKDKKNCITVRFVPYNKAVIDKTNKLVISCKKK